MDKEFLAMWFSAFDKGLSSLSAPAREALLSPCTALCADSYPVKLYERARAQSKGELDAFFILLGREKGIETRVLIPGESWQILYPACGCDLVTAGYVSAPAQCECSRLSIAYCLGRVPH